MDRTERIIQTSLGAVFALVSTAVWILSLVCLRLAEFNYPQNTGNEYAMTATLLIGVTGMTMGLYLILKANE